MSPTASPDPKPIDSLSAEEARNLIVRALGLDRPPQPGDSAGAMLRRNNAVQLDTISVLARSHELVAYARLGPVARDAVEQAYWSQPATAFEYIAHAACILPLELWPYFAFRRRALRLREPSADRQVAPEVYDEVRAVLREGATTTGGLGGARSGDGGWWNWSGAKVAVENLFRLGDVAVTRRKGWQRLYDLPERAIAPELLAHEPTDEECYVHLVALAGRALGVGTVRDIANYFELTTAWAGAAANARKLVAEAIEVAGLIPVTVEGWREPAYVDPLAFDAGPASPNRTTLLSPFDPLIWATQQSGESKERERIRRVFGFSYAFEAYVPKEKRRYGYFTMPLLVDGRLAGRVDPRREGRTLVVAGATLEDPSDLAAMASALLEAASWVGCDSVRIDAIAPPELQGPLQLLVS